MREILRLEIHVDEVHHVDGAGGGVTMILFSGHASGPCFTGEILPGGVDTQTHDAENGTALSARYMLEGTDEGGRPCRMFIENNAKAGEKYTRPRIVTDSKSLQYLEKSELFGEIETVDSQLSIKIFICE